MRWIAIDVENFRNYLKEKGKTSNAIERIVKLTSEFDEFMKKKGKSIDEATEEDLYEFNGKIKKEIDKKKINLWGLSSCYNFTENNEMMVLAQKLRASVTKKKSFLLRNYLNVNMTGSGAANLEHDVTSLGKERFEWFVKINTELE